MITVPNPDLGGPAPGAQPTAAETQGRIERAHAWVLEHWPTSHRRRLALIAVVVGVGLVVLDAAARLVGSAVEHGLLAYLGLMLVCWVGAGGALVPIPGVRPLSWIMIVQQSSSLDPVLVCVLAALAMALGQTSYFIATRTGERHAHRHGRHGPDASGLALGHAAAPAKRARPWDPIIVRSEALLLSARTMVSREMLTHPRSIIFLLSTVPNPLTTFATVTASALGVQFGHFFLASLGGFLVLSTVLVIGGQALLRALGISS